MTFTVELKYNGVTKHSYTGNTNNGMANVSCVDLMYTETPGAATQNITLVCTGAGVSLSQIKMIIIKNKA